MEYFKVIGAGKIEISEDPNYLCGTEIGFSFGVEWGRNEYAGGVLSQKEALRLADHILTVLGKQKRHRLEKLKILNSL